ncbi:MAG: sigma-70 family RNA polymerase sigma factor [Pseudomonadota bacterium]
MPHLQYNDFPNERLMDFIIEGNHNAFTILVKRNVTNFYRTAFALVKSREDAEDIVQDCFLKLWQNPEKWDKTRKVKFSTWFGKIIINRCYDHLKKFREEILADDFDIKDEFKSQENIIDENKKNHLIRDAYSKLKERQKTALSLSFIKDKKNQESAQEMGLNLKGFQSLLIRSKAALKANFNKLS